MAKCKQCEQIERLKNIKKCEDCGNPLSQEERWYPKRAFPDPVPDPNKHLCKKS